MDNNSCFRHKIRDLLAENCYCIQPGAAANNSCQYHENTVTADNSTEAVRSKSLLAAWDASQPKLILAFTHQLFWIIDGMEPTHVPYSNSMDM